jgi:Tfp pilus assembly ATPase PilU
MLRAIVSQRLVPRRDGERMAVFEIVDGQSPELALHSENGVRTPGKKNSARIDIELEHLVRSGSITPEVALAQAVDRVLLSAKLSPPSKPRLR